MCGEKSGSWKNFCAMWGSPSRVRGKAIWGPSSLWRVRITLACAGKRNLLVSQSVKPWDHPRVCGEKKPPCQPERKALGSPSRVRGKELSFVGFQPHTRITLACAGKSSILCLRFPRSGDHPRVCGEKIASWTVCRVSMWITLACAGKRESLSRCSSCTWDHPRVCGEKTKKIP